MALKKTLLKYMAIYLLLFACVCIILFPVSIRVTELAQERVVEEKQRQIELCMEAMSGQIEKYTQISSALSVNQDLIYLGLTKDGLSNTVRMVRLKKQLSYYVGMLDNVEACLLVFPSNSTVISTRFISRSFEDAYGVTFSVDGFSAEEIYQLISSNQRSIACVPLEGMRFDDRDIPTDCLLFLSCGTFDLSTSNACVFAFFIRAEQFVRSVLNTMPQDSLIVLTDGDGQVLYATDSELATLENPAAKEIVELQSGKYMILTTRSPSTGFGLTVGLPEARIYENTLKLENFVPFYIGFGMIFVAGLCVIYAVWHYRSISQLITLGEQISDLPYEEPSSYQYVQEVMDRVSSLNKEYFFKYTQTDHAYLNSMLINACIHGVYTCEEIKALERYIGSLPYFCLALIHYNQRLSEKEILNKETLLRSAFGEDELISIHPRPYSTILIISGGGSEELQDKLAQTLRQIFDQDRSGKAGVSDVLSGLKMIQLGYQQASFVLQTSMTEDAMETVVVYQPENNEESRICIATMNRLNDLVLYGKTEEVDAFFEEIERVLANSSKSEQFSEVFYSLQMVLNCLAAELKVTFPPDAADAGYPRVSFKRLRQKADVLLSCIEERQQHSNEELYRKTAEAIEQMMADPALNAATLAQNLGISEKHVYRIVKNWSGRSFGSYLEELRIKKAEELLLTSSMSNEQVAEATGFASLTTFYRAFRKAHNTSPAAWKNSVKNKQESDCAN